MDGDRRSKSSCVRSWQTPHELAMDLSLNFETFLELQLLRLKDDLISRYTQDVNLVQSEISKLQVRHSVQSENSKWQVIRDRTTATDALRGPSTAVIGMATSPIGILKQRPSLNSEPDPSWIRYTAASCRFSAPDRMRNSFGSTKQCKDSANRRAQTTTLSEESMRSRVSFAEPNSPPVRRPQFQTPLFPLAEQYAPTSKLEVSFVSEEEAVFAELSTDPMRPSVMSTPVVAPPTLDYAQSWNIVQRWERLVAGVLGRTESESQDTIAAIKTVELHPTWEGGDHVSWEQLVLRKDNGMRKDSFQSLQFNRSKASSITDAFAEINVGSSIRDESACFQRCIVHPDSKISRLMAVMSGIIIALDLVFLPLTFAFKVDELKEFEILAWVSTLFWSLDMPMSFVSGYYSNGVVEMRPKVIFCHYLKTFFVLDFVIVSSDWFTMLMSTMDPQMGVLRISRSFKYYRFIRIVRMLRLMKIFQLVKSYIDGAATELMMVLARLTALIMLLMLVSHYMACSWYALAHLNEQEITWVRAAGLENEGDQYLYTVALHWSLTQLTPATNNINPTNHAERMFAIFVVLVALINFSTFLSSLTNALRQIQTLFLVQHEEEAQMRQFLHAREVPLNLARQIWHFYRYNYQRPAKRIHYEDIRVLKKLPQALRKCLHRHIHLPVLMRHAIFNRVSSTDRDTLLIICDTCVSEVSLGVEAEVFSSGDSATFMAFLISGGMSYDCRLYDRVAFIKAPAIISELSIWGKWTHRGTLMSIESCELVVIAADEFRNSLVRRGRPDTLLTMRRYASLYTKEINLAFQGRHPITDIVNPEWDDEWEIIATRIMEDLFPRASETEALDMYSESCVGSYTDYSESGNSQDNSIIQQLRMSRRRKKASSRFSGKHSAHSGHSMLELKAARFADPNDDGLILGFPSKEF